MHTLQLQQCSKTHLPRLDTLRAFAVFLVLAYHLQPNVVPFGYLGVDIFFSLSGFLMTYLYFNAKAEKKDAQFTKQFLIRRFWRIYPPLMQTILFTLIISCLIFSPRLLLKTAKSAISAIFSFSNWSFYKSVSYFDIESIYKPLLHTWSLGIEEQFYIFFAVALYFRNKIPLHKLLLIAAVISFSIWCATSISLVIPSLHDSQILQIHKKPSSAVFYLTHYRVFQFALGGLTAYLYMHSVALPKRIELLAFVILSISFFLGVSSSYSHLSVIPLTIAVLLLIFNAPILDKIGHLRIVKYIARISYHLYLVHWPIIVFWRFITQKYFSSIELILCVILCFTLAELLFRSTNFMRYSKYE